jgi:hypothetical protein
MNLKLFRNRSIVFTIICFVVLQYSPAQAQTQLLIPGNAASYFYDVGADGALDITLKKEIIDGTEYLKRKLHYYPWWNPQSGGIRYERIIGDSCYYIRINNSDSLVFNFNWPVGTVAASDTFDNVVYEKRIDSIKIESSFLPQDTIYYLTQYFVDLLSGDTSYSLPPWNVRMYSKKWGLLDFGMNGYMQGVKYNGTRYGTVPPYPEEIYFSVDSLYRPESEDTLYSYMINSSNLPVKLDTITSIGFFEYHALFRAADSFYIAGHQFPWFVGDTLDFSIPPGDSVLIRVDYIGIGITRSVVEFIDTLLFISHFSRPGGIEYNYPFQRQLGVSGYVTVYGDADDNPLVPLNTHLLQNYPNPFNPKTEIKYGVNRRELIRISIYDILGNEIAVLVNEEKLPGFYTVDFNAHHFPSGIYFCRLSAGNLSQTRKLMLLK